MPDLMHWLFAGVVMLVFMGSIRLVDRLVTQTRARFGIAAAWGMAIGGIVIAIGGGLALVALAEIAIR